MTVAELKKILADWPENGPYGEPSEVWIETGRMLSSECVHAYPLNVRTDPPGADLLLAPSENHEWAK